MEEKAKVTIDEKAKISISLDSDLVSVHGPSEEDLEDVIKTLHALRIAGRPGDYTLEAKLGALIAIRLDQLQESIDGLQQMLASSQVAWWAPKPPAGG
jgi:hypothetical protein